MLVKLDKDHWLATGNATKDAELKIVGSKGSHVCQFSIAAGKRDDESTIFVDCKAWFSLADYASNVRKKDSVIIVGKIEERESGGRTYKSLVAEWMNFVGEPTTGANIPTGEPSPSGKPYPAGTTFEEADNEADLPF